MSRTFDSTNDRKEFENVFENLQITNRTEKENEAVSTAKIIHHLEKTTSKTYTFLFSEKNRSDENAYSGISMNPVYENKFIEKENEKCHTRYFKNTDDLDVDGNSTFGSNSSFIENDFVSNVGSTSDLDQIETDGVQFKNVHERNNVLQGSAPYTFTESQPVDRNSNETYIFEEHKHQKNSCTTSAETTKYDKNDNVDNLERDALPDEPDFFDSEEEFSELKDNSYDEMQMNPFYLSRQQAHKGSSERNQRYCSGVDQYLNFPKFMKSIRKFAFHNHFEVAESISNGNCMFHAIADQLTINGEFNHTAESLRQIAIRYLRCNPYHSSGCHLESFLSSETWKDYLSRMEKETEWGDHMMLKALSDSLNHPIIVFNVYEDDIRQTEITPDNNAKISRLTVYLGHIGEFHYLSLRPLNWEWRWPYKALIYRLLSFHPKYEKENVKSMIQKRIQNMGLKTYIKDANLENLELLLEDTTKTLNKQQEKTTPTLKSGQATYMYLETDQGKHKRNEDDKNQFLKTYCLQELQLEENKDSLRALVEDPLHIDLLTGIPLPHLSYFIRHSIPADLIVGYYTHYNKDGYYGEFTITCVGSKVDGTDATLADCSRTQRMHRSYMRTQKKLPSAIVFLNPGSSRERPEIDTTGMHPGYCRLKVHSCEELDEDEYLKHGTVIYLKAFKIPPNITETFNIDKYCAAFACSTWLAIDWRYRRKPFNWPTSDMMSDILKYGCTVIQSPHPNSDSPSIEWKFNFSDAEKILCSRWSQAQRYAFFVFKIIVDKTTSHLDVKLKNKHLKAVFFYACEQIPVDSWYRCLGGCILYVLASLVDCLNKKCLPHYFIPSNNIIDYYTSEQIETICVYVETARISPIETVQFLVEKHGYKYGSKLAKIIFNECSSFAIDRNISSVSRHLFLPNTIRVTRFLAKLGFYSAAYTLTKDVYENFILNQTYDLESENETPSFMAFLKIVLQETRDKTSRLAMATIFDEECGTTLRSCYKSIHTKTVKEAVPFEIDKILGEMQIPDEYITDLSSTAAYLDKFGYDKYKQGNAKMAGAAFSAAIRCIKHLLNEEMIDESDVSDESLKAAILSERESLNSRLITYYIHIYLVSVLRYTLTPLSNFIFDIEKHCERYPSMASIVSEMWFFLNEPEKGREYLAKAQSLK